jgi:hypothetical protein
MWTLDMFTFGAVTGTLPATRMLGLLSLFLNCWRPTFALPCFTGLCCVSPQAPTRVALHTPLTSTVMLGLLALRLPLQKPTLDSMSWYGKLFSYGTKDGQSSDDLDNKLIPRLVDKLVIPVVTAYYRSVWAPTSAKERGAALGLFKEILLHLADDATNQPKLVSSVTERFAADVNSHARWPRLPHVVPHPSKPAEGQEAALRNARKYAFCLQQWWRGLKLLKELAAWIFDLEPEHQEVASALATLAASHTQDSIVPFLKFQVEVLCLTQPLPRSDGISREDREAQVAQMATVLVQSLAPVLSSRNAAAAGPPSPLTAFTQLANRLEEFSVLHAQQQHSLLQDQLSPQQRTDRAVVLNKVRAVLIACSM